METDRKGKGKAVDVDSDRIADGIADDRKRKARGDDGDRFAKKSKGDDVKDAAKLGVSEAELGAYSVYLSRHMNAYCVFRELPDEEANDGRPYGQLCGL